MSAPVPRPDPGPNRQVVRQNTVFDHRYMNVRIDTIRHADGRESDYICGTGPDIAYALPLWPDGTVTLNSQFRYGLPGRSLEVPGGHVDAGETPLEGARRELLEETGIQATTLTPLVSFIAAVKLQQPLHTFVAEGLSQVEHAREIDEDIETVRMPLTEALEKAFDGSIINAPTIIALAAAQRLLATRNRNGDGAN